MLKTYSCSGFLYLPELVRSNSGLVALSAASHRSLPPSAPPAPVAMAGPGASASQGCRAASLCSGWGLRAAAFQVRHEGTRRPRPFILSAVHAGRVRHFAGGAAAKRPLSAVLRWAFVPLENSGVFFEGAEAALQEKASGMQVVNELGGKMNAPVS